MRHAYILLILIVVALTLPAHAEPALRLSASLTRSEVRPGEAASLTIAVFGDGLVTLRQPLDPRLALTRMWASTGEIDILQDGAVAWSGDTFPALIVLTVQARPDAPPGDIALTAVAVSSPSQGEAGGGHTAQSSVTLRVCCAEWPPPERPSWRVYFPDFR